MKEQSSPPKIKDIKKAILSLGEGLNEVEAIGIFGSLARGEDLTPKSDIDIFVVIKDDQGGRDLHMLWYKRLKRVMRRFKREITVLLYTVDSLKEICNWYVLRLASEGRLVYDKANINRLFKKIIKVAKDNGLEERELNGKRYWHSPKLRLGERLVLRVEK